MWNPLKKGGWRTIAGAVLTLGGAAASILVTPAAGLIITNAGLALMGVGNRYAKKEDTNDK